MGIGGIAVTREVPVQFRYEGAGLVGEKRMELERRSGVCRGGVAEDRGRPAAVRYGERERRTHARGSGHRRQRQQGAVKSQRATEGARGLDDLARVLAGRLHPRRRGGHDPLHRVAAGEGCRRPGRHHRGSAGRREQFRDTLQHGLSGDRIPAHPAAPQADSGHGDGEDDRRPGRAVPCRSATSWASATRCRRRCSSSA